jgi:hypothetical protein
MKQPTTSPLLNSKGTPPSRRRRLSPYAIVSKSPLLLEGGVARSDGVVGNPQSHSERSQNGGIYRLIYEVDFSSVRGKQMTFCSLITRTSLEMTKGIPHRYSLCSSFVFVGGWDDIFLCKYLVFRKILIILHQIPFAYE